MHDQILRQSVLLYTLRLLREYDASGFPQISQITEQAPSQGLRHKRKYRLILFWPKMMVNLIRVVTGTLNVLVFILNV